MSDVNLSDLSLAELKALQKEVAKAIKGFEAQKLKEARAAASAAAKEMGFSLEELMDGTAKGKTKKSIVPAKYRHPENPALTWSGRGRKPIWFKEALETGTTPEDLEIAA